MQWTHTGAIAVLCAVTLAPAAARAGELNSDLHFNASEAIALSLQDEATDSALDDGPKPFGTEGVVWVTVGAGWDLVFHKDDNYTEGFVSASWFIADDFEVILEGGVWYFAQEGPDGVGVSAILDFRWHFTGDESPARRWTVFAELGVGIVAIDEDVPHDGGDFDFLPRAGLGFTHQIGESENRLLAGVRWQHLSNARIEGGDDNPGRDGVMFYAGVMIPF